MEPDMLTGTPSRSPTAAYLTVWLATAAWASSGILVRFIIAGSQVSALALAFWRDLFSFAILFTGLVVLRPDWLRVDRRDVRWLAGLGSIGLGTFHVLWNLNVVINGVSVATVQQATMPAVVAVAAWALWREPLTRRKVLAILLAFSGTLLVSGLDVLDTMRLTLPALLVGLATPVAYSAYSLFGKPLAGRYHPLTILTYGFGFGTLLLLPFQLLTPQPWPVPGETWMWFAALVGPATILPFALYLSALRRLPASVASLLAMSEIPIAALYAYLLLGERFTGTQLIGAGLVVCGVLLLSWGRLRGNGRRQMAGTI